MKALKFGPAVLDQGDAAAPLRSRVEVGVEPRDLWVGLFVHPAAVYVCILPTVVVRIARGPRHVPVPFVDPWEGS